jgi:hypothetical protein
MEYDEVVVLRCGEETRHQDDTRWCDIDTVFSRVRPAAAAQLLTSSPLLAAAGGIALASESLLGLQVDLSERQISNAMKSPISTTQENSIGAAGTLASLFRSAHLKPRAAAFGKLRLVHERQFLAVQRHIVPNVPISHLRSKRNLLQ